MPVRPQRTQLHQCARIPHSRTKGVRADPAQGSYAGLVGEVRVGTASWTDRTLLESGWYPPEADTPEKRLRYYARQFHLVEVDATYYALPAEQTAALWAARTPPGFTFNVTAFSLFTHHPTPVAALPVDLRPAAKKTGKERVYFKTSARRWPMRRGSGFRPRWSRCATRASW